MLTTAKETERTSNNGPFITGKYVELSIAITRVPE
jgi:hypothetical protein